MSVLLGTVLLLVSECRAGLGFHSADTLLFGMAGPCG